MKLLPLLISIFLISPLVKAKKRTPNAVGVTATINDKILTINSLSLNKRDPKVVQAYCSDEGALQFIKSTIEKYQETNPLFLESFISDKENLLTLKFQDTKNRRHFKVHIPKNGQCLLSIDQMIK